MGDVVVKGINELPLNKVQKAAIELMQCDLKFLNTIVTYKEHVTPNYYVALMPYMGLIIDGVEDWIKSYNNSSKIKLQAPIFTESQQAYYEEMRKSIKFYEQGAEHFNGLLEKKYKESDKYFSSVCNPIAKHLKLYDIYGVFSCNQIPCDNTILDQCFSPYFQFGYPDGERIKNMASVAGKYIAIFDAKGSYSIENFKFSSKDYGGFSKSPLGHSYNVKFMLFSIVCQINFVTKAVNELVKEEIPTKLRFAYLLYYYICDMISSLNDMCRTLLKIDRRYYSEQFRNAMAHYKLGVALKEGELVSSCFFGLTEKFFDMSYGELKNGIIKELIVLGEQIEAIIKFQDIC